jgi:hypothetical protein
VIDRRDFQRSRARGGCEKKEGKTVWTTRNSQSDRGASG